MLTLAQGTVARSVLRPSRLQEVRTQLYELLVHCIPATVVMKVRGRAGKRAGGGGGGGLRATHSPPRRDRLRGPCGARETNQTLTFELIQKVDTELKSAIVQEAASYV